MKINSCIPLLVVLGLALLLPHALNAQLYKKGLEFYHDRDYHKAKKYLTAAYWKDENFAAAYYLGEIHRRHYECEKALDWHRIAL
jgi:lipopolysaccharide biosynthesis regulator YciM